MKVYSSENEAIFAYLGALILYKEIGDDSWLVYE